MGIFGTLGKIAGGVGGFMVGGPAGAAAGYSLASGVEKDAKANKLNKEAAGIARREYAEKAPLRAAALRGALNLHPERQDLGALYSDPGNPYNRVNLRPPTEDLTRVQLPAPAPAPPKGMMTNPLVKRLLDQRAMIGKDGLVRQSNGGAL